MKIHGSKDLWAQALDRRHTGTRSSQEETGRPIATGSPSYTGLTGAGVRKLTN